MQSLEFDGLRVEIFAPHAPSFASATRAQPCASVPTAPDASASAQVISSEPPASATPNTPLVTSSAAPAPSFAKEVASAPIIYLHALDFGATGTGEIYEFVSRRSGADFVLAAIYLSEAQWGDKLIVRGQQNRRLRGCAISRAAARRTWKNLRTS